MPALESLAIRVTTRPELSEDEVRAAAGDLAAAEVPDEAKAAFLSALSARGETSAEVAAFARAFRERALDPGVERWAAQAIDIVGTGGDHAGAFNVSSMVVFVLACAGIPVMKHGNRGITSKCGSADLMAALGVDLEAAPERQQAGLEELGFAYFFAPAYHPAFRHVAAARKMLAARGQRTVFNVLGPLINPGRPAHVLLGAYSDAWVPRLAGALEALGAAAGVAVHGEIGPGRGVDELTTAGVNHVRGFGRLKELDARWSAGDFGLKAAPFDDLKGGDLSANVALVEAVVSGRAPRGLEDTIVANAAAALWICGRTAAAADGVDRARELLLGGAVRAKIAAVRGFFRSK
jgi:anthranilate phosphoribosyltransferase